MIPVNSSNIRAVGYDKSSATLVVAFHSGSVYEYYNVPYSTFSGLLGASSHGGYHRRHIYRCYLYRQIA